MIEALVALAVLAVSAVSLLAAAEAHIARLDGLETRTLAQFAAENLLAELELHTSADSVRSDLLGHEFLVMAKRSSTADPGLERIDVTVTETATDVQFGGFIGFLDAARAP